MQRAVGHQGIQMPLRRSAQSIIQTAWLHAGVVVILFDVWSVV